MLARIYQPSKTAMRHTELRLQFATREAAIGYAEKHGIAYQIIEPRRTGRFLKAYSDNFRSDRTAPWTH